MNEVLNIGENIGRFCDSLDVKYQVDFVEEYAQIGDSVLYGGKHCGSDAEHEGSKFIAERLKEIGVQRVEMIPCQTSRYQFNDATLTIKGDSRVIKPYGYVSPGTEPEGIHTELVDGGKSTKKVYAELEIKGKAVLIAAMGTLEGANLTGQMEEAVRNGAAAILIYAVEDVLDNKTIRVQPPNMISPVPIVGISGEDAKFLREKIAEGPCHIDLRVDAVFLPDEGISYNVVGEIPGKISEEKIIYTAHLDHYFRCLQDNMSSCATLLGIAKGIIDSGYVPNRTLVFAFHGSHETGGMDTRYPYIFGSYKLVHEDKPDWSGKAIANINFEYTALKQHKFQILAYMGCNCMVKGYFPYSPELTGGFAYKVSDAPQEEYYMLSWSDSISYQSAGIPAITNDPITEQLYEGDSPYVGRDHSNMDNWEAFDEKALTDNSRMYGGLGIYLDSLPYVPFDYTEQSGRIKREVDRGLLKELEISTEEYFKQIDEFEKVAKQSHRFVTARNAKYLKAIEQGMTAEEKEEWFTAARSVNEKMLDAYRIISTHLDKINAFDFLSLASVKYLGNIALMKGAIACLEKGQADQAFAENLASVDLCLPSWYFSEEVAEHMRKQICDPQYKNRRTWAAGRELRVFAHFELMQQFAEERKAGRGYSGTITKLEEAICQEASYIPDAMQEEVATLQKAADIIRRIK